MLAEECPNDTCYGVPLVRPPKAGGEKDPTKECVICHGVYIHERDSNGLIVLRPIQSNAPSNPTQPQSTSQSTPASSAPPPPVSSSLAQQISPSTQPDVNNATKLALQTSLQALSARLTELSSLPPLSLNPVLIGETAAQIGIVLDALEKAKRT